MPLALITDCQGATLTTEETAFFQQTQPFGFILFQRHCESPDQVRALVSQLQDCVEHEAPIFIDQEGGRVARLSPPHWESYPPAGSFAALARQNAAAAERACYLNARLIADALCDVHISANCAPLADLCWPGAHDIIGDRAFGSGPQEVIRLARAQAQGLMDGGILPVVKHLPGHGRALADSHASLPVVDAALDELSQTDFQPFQALADLPFGMTAHICYPAIDAKRPATLSPLVNQVIREQIGFRGLLMSDDVSMKALQGDFTALARQTLVAGCDLVLHCNGTLEERKAVASGCEPLPAHRYVLYEAARRAIRAPEAIDRSAWTAERDQLLWQEAA